VSATKSRRTYRGWFIEYTPFLGRCGARNETSVRGDPRRGTRLAIMVGQAAWRAKAGTYWRPVGAWRHWMVATRSWRSDKGDARSPWGRSLARGVHRLKLSSLAFDQPTVRVRRRDAYRWEVTGEPQPAATTEERRESPDQASRRLPSPGCVPPSRASVRSN
jgi:hypothetical protein